jgi:hypothetical protein
MVSPPRFVVFGPLLVRVDHAMNCLIWTDPWGLGSGHGVADSNRSELL